MELKGVFETEAFQKGKQMVLEAASNARKKEFREKVAEVGRKVIKETAQATKEVTSTAVHMSKEAVQSVGAKDRYIKELEEQLEKKEKENRILRRKLAKKTWKK